MSKYDQAVADALARGDLAAIEKWANPGRCACRGAQGDDPRCPCRMYMDAARHAFPAASFRKAELQERFGKPKDE